MDFRHPIVICLFPILCLFFENQQVKGSCAIFFKTPGFWSDSLWHSDISPRFLKKSQFFQIMRQQFGKVSSVIIAIFMYVAEEVEYLLFEVYSGNLAASHQWVYAHCIPCLIMIAVTKKEIVIHSLYYDFFTNQNSPQPSIHFRLMVKRMWNHSKLCSTDFPTL